jgi:hypothetical protein
VKETTSAGTVTTNYVHTGIGTPGGSHRYDSVGGIPFVYDGEGNLMFEGQKL